MFCKNCGKELSPTAAFCPECGTPVSKQPQAIQQPNMANEPAFNPNANTNPYPNQPQNPYPNQSPYPGQNPYPNQNPYQNPYPNTNYNPNTSSPLNVFKFIGLGAGLIALLSLLFTWVKPSFDIPDALGYFIDVDEIQESLGLLKYNFFGMTEVASEISGFYGFLWVAMIIVGILSILAVIIFPLINKSKLSMIGCGGMALTAIVFMMVKSGMNSAFMDQITGGFGSIGSLFGLNLDSIKIFGAGFGFTLFVIALIVAFIASLLGPNKRA